MKYTKSDIKKLGICPDYTDERLDELAAGRESLSERELADLEIPINDRLWLLGRLCADDKNTVARRIARNVMPLWTVPDVVKRYLETGESDIKDAAWAAAWDAAGDAAWAAAGDAAGDAAWAAALTAAWAAAMAAAGDAGDAADEADAAAKQKYLGWMVEFCKNRESEIKHGEKLE
jgi:hypothetical protein